MKNLIQLSKETEVIFDDEHCLQYIESHSWWSDYVFVSIDVRAHIKLQDKECTLIYQSGNGYLGGDYQQPDPGVSLYESSGRWIEQILKCDDLEEARDDLVDEGISLSDEEFERLVAELKGIDMELRNLGDDEVRNKLEELDDEVRAEMKRLGLDDDKRIDGMRAEEYVTRLLTLHEYDYEKREYLENLI